MLDSHASLGSRDRSGPQHEVQVLRHGYDIFAFGLGLNQDVLPYFSRRIGLVEGQEVPILGGAKVNGRAGNTNFGTLVVGTNDKDGVTADEALMAVARVKQNIWRESWVGAIATAGDPVGRDGSWLAGTDFTFATSHFRGNKNFLAGVWGLATGRNDLARDASAYGFKVDYPNDLWDMQLTAKRIERDFDPSVGFVPRRSVYLVNGQIDNRTRLSKGPIQQLFHEFNPTLATDLSGHWESYRVFMAPVNWRFRSGDRFELNANPTGSGSSNHLKSPAGSSSLLAAITGCAIASKSVRRRSAAFIPR